MTFEYDIIKDVIEDIVTGEDYDGIIPLRGSYYKSDTADSAYIANTVYNRYNGPHFNEDVIGNNENNI